MKTYRKIVHCAVHALKLNNAKARKKKGKKENADSSVNTTAMDVGRTPNQWQRQIMRQAVIW
jgi:hypothetical protein